MVDYGAEASAGGRVVRVKGYRWQHELDPREDWRMQARCADADPEMFFSDFTGEAAHQATERAKAVCAGCPVRDACLDWAVKTGMAYGVWGGLTPANRRALRLASRQG